MITKTKYQLLKDYILKLTGKNPIRIESHKQNTYTINDIETIKILINENTMTFICGKDLIMDSDRIKIVYEHTKKNNTILNEVCCDELPQVYDYFVDKYEINVGDKTYNVLTKSVVLSDLLTCDWDLNDIDYINNNFEKIIECNTLNILNMKKSVIDLEDEIKLIDNKLQFNGDNLHPKILSSLDFFKDFNIDKIIHDVYVKKEKLSDDDKMNIINIVENKNNNNQIRMNQYEQTMNAYLNNIFNSDLYSSRIPNSFVIREIINGQDLSNTYRRLSELNIQINKTDVLNYYESKKTEILNLLEDNFIKTQPKEKKVTKISMRRLLTQDSKFLICVSTDYMETTFYSYLKNKYLDYKFNV